MQSRPYVFPLGGQWVLSPSLVREVIRLLVKLLFMGNSTGEKSAIDGSWEGHIVLKQSAYIESMPSVLTSSCPPVGRSLGTLPIFRA